MKFEFIILAPIGFISVISKHSHLLSGSHEEDCQGSFGRRNCCRNKKLKGGEEQGEGERNITREQCQELETI